MNVGNYVGLPAALAVFVGGLGCGGADVRIINESTYTVTELTISSPSDSVGFGTLGPGQASDYESLDEAYDRAAVTFIASNYRFEIPEPDWSTREELGGGDWTYHLNIVDFGQGLVELYTTED